MLRGLQCVSEDRARAMCDYLKSASARGHPSVSSRAVLAVVETEDIVVHVEVLRVGRSRHEQEHLTELERVGLTLHLNANREKSSNVSLSVWLRLQLRLFAFATRCNAPMLSSSPDLEVTRDKDEDTGCGLGAVDGLDGVLDGLERQTDELLNDRLGAAERLTLERQQRGGLLRGKDRTREARERTERAGEPNGSTGSQQSRRVASHSSAPVLD